MKPIGKYIEGFTKWEVVSAISLRNVIGGVDKNKKE